MWDVDRVVGRETKNNLYASILSWEGVALAMAPDADERMEGK